MLLNHLIKPIIDQNTNCFIFVFGSAFPLTTLLVVLELRSDLFSFKKVTLSVVPRILRVLGIFGLCHKQDRHLFYYHVPSPIVRLFAH